jgi:methanethiol S-methyltransferase
MTGGVGVRRWAVVAYAGLAYASFLLVAAWGVAFVAGVGFVHSVDTVPSGPAWVAVPVDVALLFAFAVQHSVMARAGFKRRIAAAVPPPVERATYVLATGVVLALLFGVWRSLPATVWRVDVQPWRAAIWCLYFAGWAMAVAATFMVDHLDFLGLRQAMAHARRKPYRAPAFTGRWLYAWMRHPMMTGLLVAFWATPHMTAGHLLFAVGATGYIAVGVWFEERDLRRRYGEVYDGYAASVPAVLPRLHRAVAGPAELADSAEPGAEAPAGVRPVDPTAAGGAAASR